MKMVFFVPPYQRRLAMQAAQADHVPTLIQGASGTGKGALARWIHDNGPRAGRVFREALPGTPLLPHLQAAQGGTIAIHEIAEWPLSDQLALLEFLKTKSVALPKEMRMLLNVRVIATSSHSLERRAEGGLFNSELLDKLTSYRIEMPALAQRGEEFEDIVLGIVAEIGRELHKEYLRDLQSDAWERLRSYDWPGNIRELRNVLRIAAITAKGDSISAADLPEFGHDKVDFRSTREQFEKLYLIELLRTFDWEIERTCRASRMNRETLLQKIERYGISGDASLKPSP